MKKEIKQEKYKKVVEYTFPDGTKFDENIFWFYFLTFLFWIGWIILSPISFFLSDYCGKRKVYFIKEDLKK